MATEAKGKLTNKQRKIVKAVSEGKTQKQAAKIADSSETYVSMVLKKPEVVATIQSLMAKHGLDDESLLKAHAGLIKATRPMNAGNTDEDTVQPEVPDWQARAKGLDMAYKLKGAFVDKKEVTFPEGLNIEVGFRGVDRS